MRSSFWSLASLFLGTVALASAPGCTYIHDECGGPEGPAPRCSSHRDCEDFGGRCDFASRRCAVPSGYYPDAGVRDGSSLPDGSTGDAGGASATPPCAATSDCTPGTVCSDHECRPPAQVCQFDFQCGSGRECVDGRCVVGCSNSASCAAGQACAADGYCRYPAVPSEECTVACAAGQNCVGNSCLPACATSEQCASGQRCVLGSCRVDDSRAPPFCSTDAECAVGSVCRAGVCRAACPTGTDEECQRRDVNFNRCGPERLCVSTNELTPGCALSVDCSAGLACVDARCR